MFAANSVPTRYVICALLFGGCFLDYLFKSVLSITIVAMVNHTAIEEAIGDIGQNVSLSRDECPVIDEQTLSKTQDGEYLWKAQDQGFLLGGFFYGYICTQFFGGLMAVKFGTKWLLGAAGLIGSVLSLLTPLMADNGITAIIATRVMVGISQGVMFPCIVAAISQWIPKLERGRLSMIIFSGSSFGIMSAMQIGGVMTQTFGWRAVYYLFGTIGLMWIIILSIWFYNKPQSHPYINETEKTYLLKYLSHSSQTASIPWRKMLTSLPMYACVIGFTAFGAPNVLLLTELPSYLQNVLNISVDINGTINAVMYVIAAIASVASGFFSDWLMKNVNLSVNAIRKIFGAFGHFGCISGIICVTYAGCNQHLAITLVFFSRTCLAIATVTDMNVVVDMAPAYAGTIFGISTTLNAVIGFSIPLMSGYFLKSGMGRLEPWSHVFYVTCAYECFAVIFYLIFGTSELQSWARLDEANTQKLLVTETETLSNDRQQF